MVGVGVESVKAAGDYQQSLTQLVNTAGESAKNIQMVGDGMKQMAIDTGTSTKQLTDGMYMIESAGFHGADGLNVLKAAAQGAKSENADLGVVANALTTAMHDYGVSGSGATSMMNGLIAAVANGKTHLQDLSGAMGTVLPLAASLHVSFPQVAGAMSAMTNAGMSAQRAAQNLAFALRALAAPNAVAVKAMKEVGLTAQQVKDTLDQKGLAATLQLVEDHVGKKFPANSVQYVTAMKQIMGGAAGYNVMLQLGGKNMQTYENDINAVSKAMKDSGQNIDGWSRVQQNLNFQLDRAKAAFEVLLITIGQKLLPIVTPLIQQFGDFINVIVGMVGGMGTAGASSNIFVGLLQKLGLSSQDAKNIIGLLGVTFSYLKDIFGQVSDVLRGNFMATFKMVGAAISDFAKNHLKDIIVGINGILYAVDSTFLPALLRLESVLNGVFMRALKGIADFLGGQFKKTFGDTGNIAQGLADALTVAGRVYNAFADFIQRSQPTIDQIGNLLKQMFIPVFDQLRQAIAQVQPFWKQFVDSIGPALPALKLIGEVIGVVIVGALLAAAYTLAEFLKALILVVEGVVIGVTSVGTSFMNGLDLATKAWNGIVSVWNAAPAFFTNLWNSIKQAVSSAWNGVVTQATSAWKSVQDAWGATGKWFGDIGASIMHALGSAWDWIKTAAANTWNAIKTAAATAWSVIVGTVTDPIHSIADSFKWLYDHNYYFQDLVDAIKKAFDSVLKWAQQQWTDFSSWITGIWQGMTKSADDQGKQTSDTITQHTNEATQAVQDGWTQASTWLDDQWKSITNQAQSAWDGFSKQVESITTSCIKTIEQVWTQATNWVTNEWNTISRNVVNAATSMWRQVSQIFSSAWSTYIVQPLTSLMTNITNWANNLIKSFQTWAANAMKGFGQSITQNIASVTTPITNVGAEIAKLLGFHSPPPAGPLAQSHTWMPNMMTMFGQGVANNTTKVTTPVNNMALQVGLSMNNLNNNVNTNSRLINMNLATIGTTAQRTNQQTGQSLNQMTASAQNAANGVRASTNQINSSIQTVNTNIQSINQVAPQAFQSISQSSQQAATDVGKAGNDISKSAQDITTSAQSINQIAPPAFQNVSRSSQQAAQDVTKSGNDMQNSAKDTANGVKGYMVTIGGSSADAADKFKTASNDMQHAAKDTDRMIQDIFKGDIAKALDDFQKQMEQKGAAIVAEAQGIASQVAALLGHTKPSLGPLRDDDTWGRHFVENIVGGMKDGMPGLTSMTNTLASTLAGGLAAPLAGNLSVSGSLASPTVQSNQPMIIYNTIDGKVISKIVTNYQARELRTQGELRR